MAWTSQLLARYRPGTVSVTDARTIAVVGGRVFRLTDPTSETAVDSTVSLAGTHFSEAAAISGAQLGKYLYLGSDTAGANWVRMKSDYTIETVSPLSKASATGATTTPAVTLFSSLTRAVSGLAETPNFPAGSGWLEYHGAPDGSVLVTLAANVDMSGYDWLLVYASCMSRNQPGTHPVQISILNNAETEEQVLGILTTNARTENSPNAIYLPLQGVNSSLRSAVRKLRFRGVNPSVPDTDFEIYGYVPIPTNPGTGKQTYYATFYNSSTLTESPISEKIEVTLTPFVLNSFPNVTAWVNQFYYGGVATAQPDTKPQNVYNYRSESILPGPERTDLVPLVTVTVTCDVSAASADKIRLYRLTENGIRLVKEVTNPGTGTLAIVDDVGNRALSNAPYKAGGTPPPTLALAAVGGRLIAGGNPAFPNRLYISSFLPFGQTTDPFPQFPDIPQESADGHSFDIAPTAAETILWLGEGDNALYIGTSEAMYVMTDLSPFSPIGNGTPPFKIWERGVIGRRAAGWWEDRLWWIGHDGIYTAQNRADVTELSKEIRRLFRTWFLPDSTALLGYQDRKLIAIRGTRYLRFDTVTGLWTRGTLAHTNYHPAGWRDPTGSVQQFWMLDSGGYVNRWQPGTSASDSNRATSDAGTAIANWTYSTGFEVTPVKARPQRAFLDTSGSVAVNFYKDATASPTRTKTFGSSGQHEYAFPPDMSGYMLRVGLTAGNLIQVKRLMIEREATDGKGG